VFNSHRSTSCKMRPVKICWPIARADRIRAGRRRRWRGVRWPIGCRTPRENDCVTVARGVRANVAIAVAAVFVAASGCAAFERQVEGRSAASTSEPAARLDSQLARMELAFMRGETIHTARADGTGERSVATVTGAYGAAHWSPDGESFVIRTEVPDDSGVIRGFIMLAQLDGTVTNLSAVSGASADETPAWAPDGRRIVFNGRRGDDRYPNIYVMNADGSAATRLTDDSFEAQYPSWSPDGSRIVFTGVIDRNFEIFVMAADGQHLTNITNSSDAENWATWSPDATQLAFFTDREPTDHSDGRVWVMDADGSDPRPVAPGATGEPDWSPNGEWIAVDCGTTVGRICAIRPDGSGIVTLFDDAGFAFWKR
jgi:Tol biopolymer transport system component